MSEINFLILSAGRRVELIKRFRNAIEKENVSGKVVAVDISESAPAIYFADCFEIIPRISDKEYIAAIIDVCNRHNVSLIIPTIDTELLKLDENREFIEDSTSAKLLLSRTDVVTVCRDKINTYKFFVDNGFGTAGLIDGKMIENGEYKFPLFIRPVDGSSSINTFKVNNKKELDFFTEYIDKPMINEFISGTEYSVDVFCDFESNPVSIVPRIRLAMRSGEIAKGRISMDRDIIDDVKRLIEVLKPVGHITVQLMKTEDGIKYIEINPRFGGGAPMSIDAGADSCSNLIKLLKGEKLSYSEDYKDGALFLRFDESIMIEK